MMDKSQSKYALILSVALALMLIAVCLIQYNRYSNNIKLLSYNIKLSALQNLDNILSKQKYSYSNNVDIKYIAIIVLEKNTASVTEYAISNNKTTNITLPKGKDFIISLHANGTISCTWNTKSISKPNIIRFIKKTSIDISQSKFSIKRDGTSLSRENLYFESLQEGNQSIVISYEHKDNLKIDCFESTLNITVK